jgi:hypothetical protein
MLDVPHQAAHPPPRRWRRYRQRQRAGAISVAVEPDVLELLLRTGWLSEEHAGDRAGHRCHAQGVGAAAVIY